MSPDRHAPHASNADEFEIMRSMFSGTIHNIGNILAMANLAVNELEEAHATQSPPLIDMILDEMLPTLEARVAEGSVQAFLEEDSQGREYLRAIRELLELQRKVIIQHRGTVESLSDKLNNINQIIGLQQQLLVGYGSLERIPLEDVMDNALKMTAAAATRHGVDVSRLLEATEPVEIDPSAFTQVLINLLKNAIEALDELPEGKPKRIEVATWNEEREDGLHACCSVADTGPGMTDEVLAHAFRFGFTTKRCTRGERGVGLSFCRKTVEKFGGAIQVESSPGKGARFLLNLPVRRETHS